MGKFPHQTPFKNHGSRPATLGYVFRMGCVKKFKVLIFVLTQEKQRQHAENIPLWKFIIIGDKQTVRSTATK